MAKISIPCFRIKKTAGGIRYYWEPSATLKKDGWKAVPLGKDEEAAIRAARARNAEVAAWRAGDASPRAGRARTTRALALGRPQLAFSRSRRGAPS